MRLDLRSNLEQPCATAVATLSAFRMLSYRSKSYAGSRNRTRGTLCEELHWTVDREFLVDQIEPITRLPVGTAAEA